MPYPRRYRLIPVMIEAMQLRTDNVDAVALWCGGVQVEETDPIDTTKKFVALNIPTLGGVRRVHLGDYIVKGVAGDFSSFTKSAFESTYQMEPDDA